MRCKSCGLEKAPSLFYVSNKSRCKDCIKARVKANRKENIEHYREFDRKRANNPERVQARRDYLLTDAGKQSKRKSAIKYIESNPKKRTVHVITGNAIRDKKIIKQPCLVCDTDEDIVAHHCDYNKPLDVMWLCSKHHTEWHVINGEGLNG